MFVLVHSPLVGPYSWALVAQALRARGHQVTVPEVRSLERDGPPFWARHTEAVARAVGAERRDAVVLVGHSGAGRLLPICGPRIPADVTAYIFVDADVPEKTESRLDGMHAEVAQQFCDAAQDGFLPPWPEDVFKQEIQDQAIRRRLVSELSPLPLAVYEEPIPLPDDWPDARCAYVQLSHRYPEAVARAEREGWPIHRFDADHFFLLVDPNAVASALVDVTTAT